MLTTFGREQARETRERVVTPQALDAFLSAPVLPQMAAASSESREWDTVCSVMNAATFAWHSQQECAASENTNHLPRAPAKLCQKYDSC